MKENERLKKALDYLKQGKMIIVCDHVDRENEGDLLMAAEFVTSEHINFMLNFGKGLICAPIASELAEKIGLKLMVPENEHSLSVAFTISLDAKACQSSGISSQDRATTLQQLSLANASLADFEFPGHIFPLKARPGLLHERKGHTEASVWLLQKAGLKEVGVLCETLDEKGESAKKDYLENLSAQFDIPMIDIETIERIGD